MSDTCRKVYNWALAERRDYYEATGKTLSFAEDAVGSRSPGGPTSHGRRPYARATTRAQTGRPGLRALLSPVKSGEKPGYPRFNHRIGSRASASRSTATAGGWRKRGANHRNRSGQLRGKASLIRSILRPANSSALWQMVHVVTFVLEALRSVSALEK